MCYCMNLILQFKTLDEQCNITGASSGEGTLLTVHPFEVQTLVSGWIHVPLFLLCVVLLPINLAASPFYW